MYVKLMEIILEYYIQMSNKYKNFITYFDREIQ